MKNKTCIFKYGLFILISVLSTSCQNTKERSVRIDYETQSSLLSNLLKFYKDTSFNFLNVYPDTNTKIGRYRFSGKEIDSLTLSHINEKFSIGRFESDGFYGVYSFDIDSNHLGLLTRIPAEFTSSSNVVWIYDKQADSIVNAMEASSVFDDGLGYRSTESFLYFDETNRFNILNRTYTSSDKEAEFEEHYSYLLTRWEDKGIDTVSNDSVYLNQIFESKIQ